MPGLVIFLGYGWWYSRARDGGIPGLGMVVF